LIQIDLGWEPASLTWARWEEGRSKAIKRLVRLDSMERATLPQVIDRERGERAGCKELKEDDLVQLGHE